MKIKQIIVKRLKVGEGSRTIQAAFVRKEVFHLFAGKKSGDQDRKKVVKEKNMLFKPFGVLGKIGKFSFKTLLLKIKDILLPGSAFPPFEWKMTKVSPLPDEDHTFS